MTHDVLAAYECYADQLELLRFAEELWAHDEDWMETLVKMSCDNGDHVTEKDLRGRLLCARLHREVMTRQSIHALRFLTRDL